MEQLYFEPDYLNRYGDPDDWVCVVDMCTTCRYTYWKVDLTAHWSPTRGRVVFGNSWAGVPDLLASLEPEEQTCWDWAARHPDASPYLRHLTARRARHDQHEQYRQELIRRYEREGPNYYLLAYGRDRWYVQVGSCGLKTAVQLLPILNRQYKEQTIHRFRVGKLPYINQQLDSLQYRTPGRPELVIRGLDSDILTFGRALENIPEQKLRRLTGKKPRWLQLPAGIIQDTIRHHRLQLDCRSNSEDNLRLCLVPWLENRILGFVIDQLDRRGWWSDQQAVVWWNQGFDQRPDGTVPSRAPQHRDIVALANQVCDKVLDRRREGRLDEQPETSPKPRSSKRSKEGVRKKETRT